MSVRYTLSDLVDFISLQRVKREGDLRAYRKAHATPSVTADMERDIARYKAVEDALLGRTCPVESEDRP